MSGCMLNELLYLILTVPLQDARGVTLIKDKEVEYWKGSVTYLQPFKYSPISKRAVLSF